MCRAERQTALNARHAKRPAPGVTRGGLIRLFTLDTLDLTDSPGQGRLQPLIGRHVNGFASLAVDDTHDGAIAPLVEELNDDVVIVIVENAVFARNAPAFNASGLDVSHKSGYIRREGRGFG